MKKKPDGKLKVTRLVNEHQNPDGSWSWELKHITFDAETGEVLHSHTEYQTSDGKAAADGKWHYKFEWNDLRALITLLNVVLVMIYGLSIAWFGLVVALIGCIKDLTEIPDGKFRFSSLIMHLSSVALNVYFLVLCFIG